MLKDEEIYQHSLKPWNELPMREKAEMMRVAVRNGLTNIYDVRDKYNEFADGGNLYDGGGYIYDVLPRLFREAGLDVRVTSGYRKVGAVGTAGSRSWHPRHGAVDIVPQGKTTFDDIERAIYSNPTIINYMLSNGFGLIDESGRSAESRATMKKTGATGPHFHFGRDSSGARRYADRVGGRTQQITTAPISVSVNNPYARQAERMWSKAQPIYQELLDAGIDPVSAAGILGNMALESGFNPNASNNINGGHWGYLQNDRNITPWVRSHYGGYDHRHQMDYLIAGMQGKLPQGNMGLADRFNGFRTAMQGVTDPEQAAYLWERHYERSDNEAIPERKGYAKYFYERMMGSNPSLAQQGSYQGELPYELWNPMAFNGWQSPTIDIPEAPQQGPIETEAMRAYRQKMEERQQVADNWNKFNMLMSLTSPQSQDNTVLGSFGALVSPSQTGYTVASTDNSSDAGPLTILGNMFTT